MNNWTVNDMRGLSVHVALVTGANSGLGLETTRALATHGAHVIMAARNLDKGRWAEAEIKQTVPGASIELLSLDLASLASVRECATSVSQTYDRLDVLFNNAGIMAIPRQETPDSFEMQFGTNHLGHFALTGLLLQLVATLGSRVVTTTSIARIVSGIHFNDLQRQRSYTRWGAYGQSKRAKLLFAFELQTRFTAAGVSTISVAAHPGGSKTNVPGSSMALSNACFDRFYFATIARLMSMGALPQLYAGTDSHIFGGELVGPGGFATMRGYPKVDCHARKEYDRSTAARLWEVSEELTGVKYDLGTERGAITAGTCSVDPIPFAGVALPVALTSGALAVQGTPATIFRGPAAGGSSGIYTVTPTISVAIPGKAFITGVINAADVYTSTFTLTSVSGPTG